MESFDHTLNKVIIADRDGYCTTEIIPLKPNILIDGKYLFYWFKHPEFLEYVDSVSHGIQMPRLGTDAGLKAPLVLAPLNEQRRIVDKLDRIGDRHRTARNELNHIPKLIARYKQAVLAAAFCGDLTADWREKNQQEVSINELIEDSIFIPSKQRSKIASRRLIEIKNKPNDWTFTRLEEICSRIVDGIHHTPDYVVAGIPFISVKDIRDGNISFNNCKFVSPETHAELTKRCDPRQGDLLVTKSGTIGRCAVVSIDQEFSLFVSVALVRPIPNKLFSEYLRYVIEYWISTIDVASEIVGSTIKNLHLQDIKALEIPLPSLEEQKEIICLVEKMFEKIDRMEQEYQKAVKLCDRLEQATLAKAFRGELVPQDPDEEPASVLLEQVKSQKEKGKKGR